MQDLDFAIVSIVVVAALLLAISVWLGLAVYLRRKERQRVAGLGPADRAAHDAAAAAGARVKEAQGEVAIARKEYTRGVRAAEKALTKGQKERKAALAAVQRALDDAKEIGFRSIGSVAGGEGRISATETTISLPQGVFAIDGVTASVDTAGNFATSSRTTLTRVATGAALFGRTGAVVGGGCPQDQVA